MFWRDKTPKKENFFQRRCKEMNKQQRITLTIVGWANTEFHTLCRSNTLMVSLGTELVLFEDMPKRGEAIT